MIETFIYFDNLYLCMTEIRELFSEYRLKIVRSKKESEEIGYTGWSYDDVQSVVFVNRETGECDYSVYKDITVMSEKKDGLIKFYQVSEGLQDIVGVALNELMAIYI